jgi:hypothetical protein
VQRPLPTQDNITYEHKDKYPCPQRDLNPRSQQPRGQVLRIRPRGHRDRLIGVIASDTANSNSETRSEMQNVFINVYRQMHYSAQNKVFSILHINNFYLFSRIVWKWAYVYLLRQKDVQRNYLKRRCSGRHFDLRHMK